MTIRLGLLDDHRMIRETLRAVLDAQTEFLVVGEAETEVDAHAMLRDTHPDVLLLDLGLPGVDGLALLRSLRRRYPSLVLLVVSANQEAATIGCALCRGAQGYAYKTESIDALCDAVLAVARGERRMPPGASVAEVEAQVAFCTARHHDACTRNAEHG